MTGKVSNNKHPDPMKYRVADAGPPPPPPPPPSTPTGAKPADTFGTAPVTGPNASNGSAQAAKKYDVSDDAQLATLRAGSPDDQKIADEIENVRKNYKPLMDAGAKLYITTSPGNGNSPAVMVVPKALQDNPNQPFNVDVHYGGMHGTAANPDPKAHSNEKIGAQMNATPPTVFIIPEGAKPVKNPGRAGQKNDYNPDWSNATDPRKLADDSLKLAGLGGGKTDANHPLIVSAHSAGGRAVANAITAGNFTPDKLELQDCLYGNKMNGKSCADAVLGWASSNAGVNCKTIDYVHTADGQNGQEDRMPKGLKLRGGQQFTRVDLDTHYQADYYAPKKKP